MEIEGVFSALFAGIVIGALGRLLSPGHARIGCLLTILIGVVGAALGTAAGMAIEAGFWLTLLLQVLIAAVLVSVFAAGSRR